ncbi:hypothetical protein BGW39_008910 [Mortierella sp. 14UC]|nr:hypothetical protein BGW39_008910 [Mortierella sp. 14UC]
MAHVRMELGSSDKRCTGYLAIKFDGSSVAQKTHKENETSGCFLQKDGTTWNSTLANRRRDFVASGTPSNLRGILRTHLEFPDIQYGMPATHVLTNPVTGDQDVMVYINISNMDDVFFEGISEHKDDMVRLKMVIRRLPEINTSCLAIPLHALCFNASSPLLRYFWSVAACCMDYNKDWMGSLPIVKRIFGRVGGLIDGVRRITIKTTQKPWTLRAN